MVGNRSLGATSVAEAARKRLKSLQPAHQTVFHRPTVSPHSVTASLLRAWHARLAWPRFGRAAWLALLLTIPALLPLLAPGYFFKAHDAHHSVFFLVEFDQAIRDGALWPVWGPDHALGFGYPLWLLYAPLAYYVAEAFHLIGLGFTAAVKATWALSFVIGALGAYRLARRWWGHQACLVASLAFTYAPYHLAQIYVRAALAEFAALGWFPWVLLAFDALWHEPGPRRAALAALALGALLLTHTVSTLIFIPLLAGFLLVKLAVLWRSGAAQGQSSRASSPSLAAPIGWTVAALLLGGLLATIFLLPMLLERGYIVEAQWVHDTYNYIHHFVYPSQFFSPFWGFGYSVDGPQDGMSFQLGLLPFVIALLGAAAALRRRSLGLPFRGETVFLAVATVVTMFAMTPAAQPIWDALPLVGLIQFPWRLLALTATTLALLAGAGVHWLESRQSSGKNAGPYVYLIALALVLGSFAYTRPELLPIRPEDESPLAIIEFETQYPDMRGMTSWSTRLPLDADSPLLAQYRSGQPLQKAAIVSGDGTIVDQRHGGASEYALVNAAGTVRLRFYTYYFPGWRATVDDRPVELAADPPNGLIGLELPPGIHQVRLRFGATPVHQVATLISLASLGCVGLLLFAGRRPKISGIGGSPDSNVAAV